MYYRRKILLGLLQSFESKLDKIHFQKLLFLFTRLQAEKSFEFIPHKYGCYSFQATADMKTMIKYNLIADENNYWIKVDTADYLNSLFECDRTHIIAIKDRFCSMSVNEIVKFTYINYPYYAINSVIAPEILNSAELQNVNIQKNSKSEYVLYTIGYEGKSIESYINTLILNDVRVLCDVRKNALSRKFGFSKNQLQKSCTAVGIEYIHIPELGIESEDRQNLNNQHDYDLLFDSYNQKVLPARIQYIQNVAKLVNEKKRVALTCFEKDHQQCHRTHLANAVMKLPDISFTYQIL